MNAWAPETRRDEILVRAGLALTSELSLPIVLQKIADLAAEVADARYAALGVLTPEGTSIQEFVTHGITDEERARIGDVPQGHGILGALIHEALPLRLPRIQDDRRSIGFPPHHPPMTTFLGVPVEFRGKVFGNLYLTEKHGGREFTQEDEDAVVQLANFAGVAAENARLYEEVQRLALVEDRERIAKELHDDIIQSLFAEGMSLQASLSMLDDPTAMEVRITQAVDHIDRVIRDLRNYIFGLRPGAAADRQLDRALRDLAAGFAQGEVAIDVQTDPGAVSHLAGRSVDVLSAAREAISNAVRHAKAEQVRVTLSAHDDVTTLEVEDDGKGFDVGAAADRGHGLGNLQARAAALGGRLDLESEPGRGTVVRITIPR